MSMKQRKRSRTRTSPEPQPCYRATLFQAINRHLPASLFAPADPSGKLRWCERYLTLCVLLMAWSAAETLADRFDDARRCLVAMFPGRRRPGRTYPGLAAALARDSERLLATVADHLRGQVRAVAAAAGPSRWEHRGFVPIGADGSKVECPMTAANEAAFGCAGKRKSTPQQFVTTLLHLPSGLVWAYATGPARSSERAHLREMLPLLPPHALLVADAGFTGYDLLSAILAGGSDLLIRVGANVRLLRKLGYAVEERGQTVYLWPDERRDKPPLVLRLVTLVDGRNRRMHLLTSVLDEARLGDEAACELYTMRWGVELHYRALKQTLARRRLKGDSPSVAAAELRWAMVGLWLLCLMGCSTIAMDGAGGDVRRLSVAGALRHVRRAMRRPGVRFGRAGLERALAKAVRDRYERKGSKRARHWPHKKKPKPIGDPEARDATEAEILLAQSFLEQRPAA